MRNPLVAFQEQSWVSSFEVREYKTSSGMCTQRRLRAAWVSAQSDLSLRSPHGDS